MIPPSDKWRPVAVSDIQSLFGEFTQWVLCGGQSIDWMLGKATREHGDTDVGVFRTDIDVCLNEFDQRCVFLCDPPGKLVPWDGLAIPAGVHDIWIANENCVHWAIQLMVYDDENDSVIYRRDKRISWPKSSHAITVRGVNVLNPFVTLLFKLHRHEVQDKDCRDVSTLIHALANNQLISNDSLF